MTITAQDAVSDTLPKELSVDHMADDMLGFLAELCVIRVHIIDHAAGGVAGLAMALKAPEHVGRLVVVNGWSQPDSLFLRCFETRLAPPHESVLMPFLRARPLFL